MLALTATSALLLLTALFASGFADFKHNPRPPVSLVGDSVPRAKYEALAKKAHRRLLLIHRYKLQRNAAARQNFSSVYYALRLASVVYGIPYGQLSSVSWCESHHFIWARNGQYRSLFQEGPMFERGPFGRAGFSVWDPIANAMTAAYTVSREGWRQWECASILGIR